MTFRDLLGDGGRVGVLGARRLFLSNGNCLVSVGGGAVVIAVVIDVVGVVVVESVTVTTGPFPSETTELVRLCLTVRCLAGMGGGRIYGGGSGGGFFLPD